MGPHVIKIKIEEKRKQKKEEKKKKKKGGGGGGGGGGVVGTVLYRQRWKLGPYHRYNRAN